MVCGFELMEIVKETERLKDLRRIQELVEAEKLMQKRKEETIHWCDTILSDYLKKIAAQGYLTTEHYSWTHYDKKNYEMKFCMAGRLHHETETLRSLTCDGKVYSDGTPSLCAGELYLDTETVMNYCKEHCILVKLENCSYYTYGSGSHNGKELTFKLAPECMMN